MVLYIRTNKKISMLESLSIVTITYNNPEDLLNTYNSLTSFRNAGGQHIIVNGGTTIKHLISNDCVLLEEPDKGIYDALNKGINLVKTPYLMLIHSGDLFVATLNVLEEQITVMTEKHLDVMLNDCTIEFGTGTRHMSSRNWKPWMFKLGAQPPHPPTIYKSAFVENFKYDTNHSVIADFDYLERLFKRKPKYDKGKQTLVFMSAGGKTSSGLSSFFYVTKEFVHLKGLLRATFYVFLRPIIKVLQML